MKLWAGSYHNPTDPKTDDFNSSISFDQCMFREDIAGSIAHADMLCSCGILSQVDRDAIDLMLGNIDNIAEMQANIEKANTAVDVLVTVKNEVLSAYNSIINMQI